MADIIVSFNRTSNANYLSYGKLNCSISYADNIAKKTTTAKITAKFYIKPDEYTYTNHTIDNLYIGIKKATSSAALIKKNISPTFTSGKTVAGGVYNLVGTALFEVEYDSTTTYPIHCYVGYSNRDTTRFAPFVIPESSGGFLSYTYLSSTKNVLVLDKRLEYSPCTTPTTFSTLPTIFDKSINLNWSVSSGGNNNAVIGYGIEYQTSSDNKNFGGWTALTPVKTNSATVTPNILSGHYIRYKIRAMGTAGALYYSGFKESTTTQKKLENCGAPTIFKASPNIFENEITLSWSGAAGKTNNKINSYLIQQSISSDRVNFGGWSTVATVVTALTAGSYKVSPTVPRGGLIKFQIKVQGSAGTAYYSNFKVCESIKKNVIPLAPVAVNLSTLSIRNGDSVIVSWSAVNDENFSYYELERSINGSNFEFYTKLTGRSISVGCAHGSGAIIKFRVRAVDGLGVKGPYKESSVLKINTAPLAPLKFTVSPLFFENGRVIKFEWLKASDIDGNATHYEIGFRQGSKHTVLGTTVELTFSHTAGAEIPEGVPIAPYIRAIDALGEKSSYNFFDKTLIKRDCSVSVGIDGKWIRKRVYLGSNGIWKPVNLFYGINDNWQKSSSTIESGQPEIKPLVRRGLDASFDDTYFGSKIFGGLWAIGNFDTCLVDLPVFEILGKGNIGYTATLPIIMRGFKTDTGFNYTDEKGVKWRADYFDFGTLELHKLVGENFSAINEVVYLGKDLDFPPEIRCFGGWTRILSNTFFDVRM